VIQFIVNQEEQTMSLKEDQSKDRAEKTVRTRHHPPWIRHLFV